MGMLIKSDGTKEQVRPKNGKAFTLEEMQGFVGGYIESVNLPDNLIMWLNEEGEFLLEIANQRNDLATQMLHDAGGMPDDYVCGDVLVCTPRESGDEE